MKLFRGLLLCLALAVLGALAWQWLASDRGEVIVRFGDTVYVTTVAKGTLLLALALAAVLALLGLLRLPFRLWQRRRRRQAQAGMGGGLVALHEARWARAESLLGQAARHPSFRVAARLGAAQAALARGDTDAFERHLAATGDTGAAAALARARQQLASGQAQAALATLDAAVGPSAPVPGVLLLRVRALTASRRAGEAFAMLGALRRAQVLAPAELAALEVDLAAQAMRAAGDGDALADRWDRLPGSLRCHRAIVSAYAQRAIDVGQADVAAEALARFLENEWDETLAHLYGRIPATGNSLPTARLRTAEAWLRAHPDSPALALTLGRLCAGLRRWEESEDYLRRAIKLGAGADAWEELGHVHAARGDDGDARQCYANALRAGRGEAVVALGWGSGAGPTAPVVEPGDDPGMAGKVG